jgi:GntR family transcriptional regulator
MEPPRPGARASVRTVRIVGTVRDVIDFGIYGTRRNHAAMPRMYYTDIAEQLEAEIRRGEFKPGDKLPTYTELGMRFGVGHQAVAKAIALLKDRGLVEGQPPIGVFVRE